MPSSTLDPMAIPMSALAQLQHLVVERGEAVSATRIRVDGFLNHRVDPVVLDLVAAATSEIMAGQRIDLVLTAEAGGIAPASATARALKVPMVYAKKFQLLADPNPFHVRRIKSPTKAEEFDLGISRRVFQSPGRVLVVDDVLAGGTTADVLCEFVAEAGGVVAAMVVVIEKTFQAGRRRLGERGVPVHALVPIRSLEAGIELGYADPGGPEPETTTGFV